MELLEILLILAGSLAVTAFARWRGLPAPLLVVAVALLVSFIPGIPDIKIDSEVILTVILPPLLYSASLDVSFQNFRQSLVQIRRLGIGLVIVTALVAGFFAYMLIPDMTLPAAFLIGAVVAPPDAVSAAAIGRKLGLPRKVMTVISGESLINDAASLTLVKVFLAIVGGAALTVWDDLGIFGLAIGVGVAVGLVLGMLAHSLRMRVGDPVVEIVIGLLLPFLAYIVAEQLQGSGVLAVVAAGLYVGFNSPKSGYASRLQERPLWSAMDITLEGFVFALIGLQLKTVVLDVAASSRGLGQSVGVAFIVLGVVILTRPVFLFVTYYWSRLVRRLVYSRFRRYRKARVARMVWGRADPKLSWQQLVVISWTGMRGVVTLAAAVSIPLVTTSGVEVPARDTMFLIAFVVTVGTLLLQGLTLPSVIRWLGVQDLGQAERDVQSELRLVSNSTDEAIEYLDTRRDDWSREWGREPVERGITILKERLRRQDEAFRQGLREDADDREGQAEDLDPAPFERGSEMRTTPQLAVPDITPDPTLVRAGRNNVRALASIRRELLQKRRELVLRERDAGNLDEEVMRRVLLGLDAEELAMDTSAVSRTRS
ncbi:putative Na(+)/H(+) exchanger [Frondihabitans sp. 762G35]|uniref:cation:proton antiporter n=1 Tax=Frondihabitans sp. 762G35 TaxID=1446794 RepID=UPI000D22A4E5|nr:sodium:proton antiporter [Frondihabitans sp. 762G35]ARC56525.1 putative Na(+)/H(+) exchanger [Frondihabitans sp. 762G35]